MTSLDALRRSNLERTLAIVAGTAPVTEIARTMDERVTVHMDGLAFVGRDAWVKWIRYQRTHARVVDVVLEIDAVEQLGRDSWRVTMRGRGRDRDNGQLRRSSTVEVRYRWSGARIVEAWTRRDNYEFFFGPRIRTRLGFVALLARIVAWNFINPMTPTRSDNA